ncbi:MAG: membrane protein insertase YidC [Balneola sp.]
MDKNTATGLGLIFLIMVAWFVVSMPSEEERAAQIAERARQDSLAQIEATEIDTPNSFTEGQQDLQQPTIREDQTQEIQTPQTGLFSTSEVSEQSDFTVTTPLYTAVFSNRGAGPISFTFSEYDAWAGAPFQLISDSSKSAYNFGFLTTENYNVDTQNLLFTQINSGSSLTVGEGDTRELKYALQLSDGRQVVYTYTFISDTYEIDLDVEFIGVRDYIIGNAVDFGWNSKLNSSEKDKKQEGIDAAAYVFLGDELEKFKVDESGRQESNFNGNIDWTATRTKFFTQFIKPLHPTQSAFVTGEVTGEMDDPQTKHKYTSAITSSIPDNGVLSYKLFVGPLKYHDIKKVDEHAYDMVEVGYNWLRFFSDPFVRFIVIPFFTFFSGFISNYGILVIIFAASIKLVLSPLTFKSYKSMAAMRELQPQLKELQDKYKDNPQKQQQETMKLYKKNKVNPLGGCLPNLLQFPILITLWRFFQNSILLRQEEFLWASDLSAPDYIINLPFSIPFLGDSIGGFVLLMSIAMMFQSKLTGGMSASGGGNNPMAQQMKVLQYIFPVMLLFIFNNFASGLSLYYLIFNVLSIAQQLYINKTLNKDKDVPAKA